jgi:hypothetical protein
MFRWLRLGIPRRILIKRDEDYHTHYVGFTADRRHFFGCETFVFPDGVPDSGDWTQSRKEYVVLYVYSYWQR